MIGKPPVRFAKVRDGRVGYQIAGDGPPDVLLIAAFAGHLDWLWEAPGSRTPRHSGSSLAPIATVQQCRDQPHLRRWSRRRRLARPLARPPLHRARRCSSRNATRRSTALAQCCSARTTHRLQRRRKRQQEPFERAARYLPGEVRDQGTRARRSPYRGAMASATASRLSEHRIVLVDEEDRPGSWRVEAGWAATSSPEIVGKQSSTTPTSGCYTTQLASASEPSTASATTSTARIVAERMNEQHAF